MLSNSIPLPVCIGKTRKVGPTNLTRTEVSAGSQDQIEHSRTQVLDRRLLFSKEYRIGRSGLKNSLHQVTLYPKPILCPFPTKQVSFGSPCLPRRVKLQEQAPIKIDCLCRLRHDLFSKAWSFLCGFRCPNCLFCSG